MALPVIKEPQLHERLSAHQAWLNTFNQGKDSVTGVQLSLVDEVISGMTLSNEDLSNVEIIGCKLSKVRFENCDLSYADLTGSVFVESTFTNCQFVKADLKKIEGRGVDFSQSDFTRADLTDAVLSGADFTNCVFDWAWLVGTDLRHAKLEGVGFTGARLSGTKLSDDRKFKLGSTERTVVDKVELSLGNNRIVIVGDEVFRLISCSQ